MKFLLPLTVFLGLLCVGCESHVHLHHENPPDQNVHIHVGPNRPSRPAPDSTPHQHPHRPVYGQTITARDDTQTGGLTSPDGKEKVTCPLPVSERKHNCGGRDGAGLCVFTSIEHTARWQNEPRLWKFQEEMKKEFGGGYPSKVDEMIKKYAAGVSYLQYEGHDPAFLQRAIRTGRMVSVTYNGHDVHYGGMSIAHMVNLVHLSEHWACILDNNFPGENELVWMSPSAFYKRWTGEGDFGNGWAVVLLNGPPPPEPFTATDTPVRRINDDEIDPDKPVPTIEKNFGLDLKQLSGHESCTWSGKTITREAAWNLLEAESIPDDRKYLRLTVISTQEALRAKVLMDLKSAPELGPWRNKLVVQSYAPENWAVTPFRSRLDLEIIVQDPSGKVLFHQADYLDGPKGLAITLAEADKVYDPSKVQDARTFDWMSFLKDHTTLCLIGAGCVLVMVWAAWPRSTVVQVPGPAQIVRTAPSGPDQPLNRPAVHSDLENLLTGLLTALEAEQAKDARRKELMSKFQALTAPKS